VNACPADLDPVGWRAAVLAIHECEARYSGRVNGEALATWLQSAMRDGMDDCDAGTSFASGYDAYQRALAPRVKVAPERKGMTWKTRGPALPVDDGRDDD
jgi:hypothetical protein